MKVFFCYERSPVNRSWIPKIYYSFPADTKGSGRDPGPERSPIYERDINQILLNIDMINMLQEIYKAPS